MQRGGTRAKSLADVDRAESPLAGRDGSHGARDLRAPAGALSQALRGRRDPRRRFSDRRGAGRDGGGKRIRPARPVSGHGPALSKPWRRRAPAQHGLALPPPDPGLLGRARRGAGRHRPPRADPRDWPPFRALGRRYGRYRGGRGLSQARRNLLARPLPAFWYWSGTPFAINQRCPKASRRGPNENRNRKLDRWKSSLRWKASQRR